MTKQGSKRSKSFWKERILRYGPVVFIRKNIFLFSFLLLLTLTILFGVWDIKRYEIYDLDGNELESVINAQMQEYIKENVEGENYFLFSPTSTSREMYLNISRLKSVRIEKVVPNKLIFFVEVYEPSYVSYLKSESCKILSSEGIVLDSVCEEENEEEREGESSSGGEGESEGEKEEMEIDTLACCREYSTQESLIFFSSPDVEISVFDNDKDRLLIVEEVKKVVEVVEAFQYKVGIITLENEILEVTSDDGVVFRFTVADDIDTQLKRFVVVVGKVKSEYIDMGFLDLRFERPVMKE
jgi:hypothetical protein